MRMRVLFTCLCESINNKFNGLRCYRDYTRVRGSTLDATAILALTAAAPRLRKLHVSAGQTDATLLT